MICRDLMHHPVSSCTERQTVRAAALQMRDAGVGFLPVCDETGRARGILTDRDLAIRVCAAGLDPNVTRVAEVMTHELVECHPEDELQQAHHLMAIRHKSRILVTDAEGHPEGVISLADMARKDPRHTTATFGSVVEREHHDSEGGAARH